MTANDWHTIARGSLFALGGEAFVGFALAFSPGWANGWAFGLSIHSVWSAGMSIVFFVLLVTSAIGMGAATMAACAQVGVGPRQAWAVFAIWLACAILLAVLASYWAFGRIYESAVEMWPNGYNFHGPDRG